MSDTATPAALNANRFGTPRPKVPPFARFEGTSAWKKDRLRAREYAKFLAAARHAAQLAESAGR